MNEDKTKFTIDRENLLVKVERTFEAPLDLVWSAWTEAEILDQWWGPQPYKAVTKTMDFRVGGQWLYAMVGPEGVKGWNVKRFTQIDPRKSFAYRSLFCDENGNAKPETTGSNWTLSFAESKGVTVVTSDIRVDSLAHLEAQVKMGFKEGYTVGLNQLDALLARLAGRGK
jgi:PhnB protein